MYALQEQWSNILVEFSWTSVGEDSWATKECSATRHKAGISMPILIWLSLLAGTFNFIHTWDVCSGVGCTLLVGLSLPWRLIAVAYCLQHMIGFGILLTRGKTYTYIHVPNLIHQYYTGLANMIFKWFHFHNSCHSIAESKYYNRSVKRRENFF